MEEAPRHTGDGDPVNLGVGGLKAWCGLKWESRREQGGACPGLRQARRLGPAETGLVAPGGEAS